jgi:hypothetical protein
LEVFSQLASASRPFYHNTANTNAMADRQEDAIAPAGSPRADRADQATATSRENASNTSEFRDAAQDDTTTDDAMEKALSASLELLNNNNGIDQGTSTLAGDLLRCQHC